MKNLKDYEKRLEAAYDIIEKSAIVVFEWSIGPNIPVKFVTENISKYGYSSEDFYSGKVDYWDFLHKDDVEKTRNNVYEKRDSGKTEYKHIYRVLCKDGTIRWVEEWTSWERDKNGKPITEKGIIRDITEQIETAEKLKRSEERYRNLFENACAIICTFNPKGEFTTINKECMGLTGYNKSELLRMTIFDFLLSPELEDCKNDENYFIKKIEENINDSVEITIKNKSGVQIILEGKLLIIDGNNEPIEVQGVFQDVTAKKEAENKIYYLSYHDKLTDLYNRAYFDKILEELDRKKEFPFCLITGDINGLKQTNDRYGHNAGDKLLQTVAKILKNSCRETDIVARVGGDEFSIILPKCTAELTEKICSRIKKACESYDDGSPIKPDISLGFCIKKDCSMTIDELITEADKKMYNDKFSLTNT